jgi:hypothetical protein
MSDVDRLFEVSMNKVYCWYPKLPNVGHASLDISFGAGGGKAEYVSWWPRGTGDKGTPGAKPLKPAEQFGAGTPNYAHDVAAEGRQPDKAVTIDCLDEDLMRAKYKEMKKDLTYNMTVKNCASAVANVLLAGGACLSIDCMTYAKRAVWTPAETLDFALLINSEARVIKAGIANGFKPALQWPTLQLQRRGW